MPADLLAVLFADAPATTSAPHARIRHRFGALATAEPIYARINSQFDYLGVFAFPPASSD
jgi:hypothetical protein